MKRNLLLVLLFFVCSSTLAYAQQPKKVSVLGDSYSTFEGHVTPTQNAIWYFLGAPSGNTDVKEVRETWWSLLCSRDEYELCVNNSFSGSTVCNTGYNGEDCVEKSFIGRMNQLGDPDIILIFGGTNDSWANVPIGAYQHTDWSVNDLYCFRAGMSYLLSQMKKIYPSAQIYFILNNELKAEVDSSVMTICDHHSVPYIELVDIEKLSGHPSVKGMQQICQQVANFIE
ncbi:MAG: SGNH/GDSL hydrolase family protein [Rikenellaceae bacterium]